MNIAILYQVKEPPQVGNIRKPMKEGDTVTAVQTLRMN